MTLSFPKYKEQPVSKSVHKDEYLTLELQRIPKVREHTSILFLSSITYFKFLILFLLLPLYPLQAQNLAGEKLSEFQISGKWMDENLNFLVIPKDAKSSNAVIVSKNNGYFTNMSTYEVIGDTLILVNQGSKTDKNSPSGWVDFRDEYNFHIQQLSSEILTLVPINSNALLIYGDSLIHMKRFGSVRNSRFSFQGILFESGFCYGNCPNLSIHIDQDGNVDYKRGNHDWDNNPIFPSGQFKGQLEIKEMKELVNLLNSMSLSEINFVRHDCCDAPMRTIKVSYNHNIETFESMFLPPIFDDLILFFLSLHEKVALETIR